MEKTTIAALSTPQGTGGLHVIRVSGPEAFSIVDRLFVSGRETGKTEKKRKKPLLETSSHRLRVGRLTDPETGEVLDEAVLSIYRGPKSFTGEDTVEITCHGGMYIVRRILTALIHSGCHMAEPGEFSRRAFMNGRMDLTKAEAVMDMIDAKTSFSLKAASQQLTGNVYQAVEKIRRGILDLIVTSEVNIDYPEYDVPEISEQAVMLGSLKAMEEIDELLATAATGKLMRSGITAALLGSPNVGKSSLLNALLQEERAIVTDIPGTTRDVIEESVNLGGLELKLVDTAGVRKTDNLVEKLGVERSLKTSELADLTLFILDGTRPATEEEISLYDQVKTRPHLVLINKEDLRNELPTCGKGVTLEMAEGKEVSVVSGRTVTEQELLLRLLGYYPGVLETEEPILISAKTGEGLEKLEERIKDLFFDQEILQSDRALITNLRQEEALRKALEALTRVKEAIGMPLDLLMIDLTEAADALGEVTGESTREDVVSEIFKRFCLGK